MAITRSVEKRQAGKVELLPGLRLWREVTVVADDYKGYGVEVRVVLDDGRLTAREVTVTQREGGPPVTGEALRQVTVAAFVRRSIEASAPDIPREPGESFQLVAFGLLQPPDVTRMRDAGPVAETLGWVAKIYTLALATGDRPTKAVEEVFEVPGYTATRWVAKAREKGLLASAAEPKRA